jgi:hypothetical protein
MGIGIKVKNSMPASRIENRTTRNWHQGGGVGLNPNLSVKRIEGIGHGPEDRIRYEKGYSRTFGICKTCKQYKGEDAPQGEHCKLGRCDK